MRLIWCNFKTDNMIWMRKDSFIRIDIEYLPLFVLTMKLIPDSPEPETFCFLEFHSLLNHRIEGIYQGGFAMRTEWSVQKLIYTGTLAAVAGAFVSLEFSAPMISPLYRIDSSDMPPIIVLLFLGPVSVAWVEIIKIITKLITVGTNSMYVGESANLIGIVLSVVPM